MRPYYIRFYASDGSEIAAGIPAQTLSLIYINAFDAWAQDRLEDEPCMDVPESLAMLAERN